MATASVIEEANERECSVCHEEFREPKVLPCGHLLCRHCLLSWLQSQPQAHCPLCRCAIVEGEAGQGGASSVEDTVEGFPTDLAMAALVEAQRLLSKDHSCCVCEDVAATSLCLHCGDTLCKACTRVHGKLSMTKHHRVEDLTSLTAEQLTASRPSTCAAHPEETCKLFCPSHGLSVCLLCASSKHRGCPQLKDLQEKTEEARALLAEMAARLSAGEAEIDRAISELERHLHDTETRTKKSVAQMEADLDRLQAALNACRRRIGQLAEGATSDDREAVQDGKSFLLQKRSKLTSHKAVIERATGSKSGDVVNDMMTSMEQRIQELDCSATLPANAKVISKVSLVIDPGVVTRIEQDLAQLGQVNTIPAVFTAISNLHESFSFHDNHGKNIVLSNNKQTAERTRGNDHAIVMSRDPMQVGVLYEVQIDKWDDSCGARVHYHLVVGVVTQPPDTLTLSKWSGVLHPAAVLTYTAVKDSGPTAFKFSTIGSALKSLRAGSRVGVAVDSSHGLHLYVNGQDQGVFYTNLPQPCYALFDVSDYTRKITTLPLTKLA
ncbi:E3 ubiquitin-protein ligase TRIM56-like isoform X2 [Littorina saxatilis]|uniref:E3 ubiquitin-protein ligase TRIM56-like isoform X2 n=1 Tax=Littorina saxatilis TaxID=31220 RepID=UPI0038B54F58